MTKETDEIHPDTPAWLIPYLLQNQREHYDLGSRIDRMESRLLWRGFVGLTAIGSIIATAVAALAVVAVKFL